MHEHSKILFYFVFIYTKLNANPVVFLLLVAFFRCYAYSILDVYYQWCLMVFLGLRQCGTAVLFVSCKGRVMSAEFFNCDLCLITEANTLNEHCMNIPTK